MQVKCARHSEREGVEKGNLSSGAEGRQVEYPW